MNWLATLRRSGGIHALARQIGSTPSDVLAGADALLPSLLDRTRTFVTEHGGGQIGAKALLDMLAELGDGNLAAEIMGPGPLDPAAGEILLGRLYPSAQERAEAVGQAAAAGPEGADVALLERLHAPLAMLLGGYIAARAAGSSAPASGIAAIAELLGIDRSSFDPRPRRGSS